MITPTPDLSTPQLEQLLAETGWPASAIPTAIGIIGSESSGNPNVVAWGNGSSVLADSEGWPAPVSGYDEAAVGVFQDLISPASAVNAKSIAALQDPVVNSETALAKYEAGGWTPWTGDGYINAHPSLLTEGPAPANKATAAPTSAQTTGYNWNPLHDAQTLAGNTAGSVLDPIMKSIGIYILKGILSLAGAAIFVYGAKLTTERGAAKQAPNPAPAGVAAGGGAQSILGDAPEAAEAFPEAALL